MKNKMIFSIALFASLSLVLTSCNEDSDDGMSNMESKAQVRVIHTSYDAPAVDVAANGQTAIQDLAYGISSGYAGLNAGSTNLQVTPAGANSPVVIDADVVLEQDKDYTVIAAGALSGIEPVVVEDSREAVGDKAKIRFAHMSPDAPAVDIKLDSGQGTTVFGDVAFKEVANYIEVDGGSYVFAVTPANSSDEVIVFDPITVENGKVYTVTAKGTLNGNDQYPFIARVFVDNGAGDVFVDLTAFGNANAMVVHASPDAPAVDLRVDDMVAGSGLEFPNNTSYLPVTGGTRNIKVNAAGTSTTVIEADIDFMKDMYYSIFAVDSVSKIEPLLIEDDLTPPAAGNAHARFIHLSPNAQAVDITTTDGNVVFADKSFKEYTAFTPLAAGTYDLQVRLQGTESVVLDLSGITLEDGKIYTIFAKGFVGGTGSQELGAQIIVNM
ncbi:MAG: DUF4397 domain-containing protein [Caldithrix sp.]|nr:DUF4397 domain-containing protein [Caldithrix sp.]